jgi:hypothetical protein
MSEEEKGFVIRDKRGRTESEPQTGPEAPQATSTSGQGSSFPSSESVGQRPPSPPISFSSFVFSLGSSALMLMGETLDPQQPSVPMNLPQAKEIIDILSVLETKTKGNLTSDESSVLTDMLYTLRMNKAVRPYHRQAASVRAARNHYTEKNDAELVGAHLRRSSH